MERHELSKQYREKTKELWKPFFNEEKDESITNPALRIHETVEVRPYCVDDFKRKTFHMDLIGPEEK